MTRKTCECGTVHDRGIVHRPDRPSPWMARYRSPRGQVSKSFTTLKRAEAWLRAERSSLDAGRWVDPGAGTETYGEWATRWLDGLTGVKPKTEAGYRSLMRARILPEFGGSQLRHITRRDVQSWIGAMEDEGLSPSRIKQARQVLSQTLDIAVLDGVIAKNPTKGTKVPRKKLRKHLYLTDAQVDAIADRCDAVHRGSGALVWFLAWSGARWGEAIALQARSVNIEKRTVEIARAVTEVDGVPTEGVPKDWEERTLTLPRFVMERLTVPEDRGALVFPGPKGWWRVSTFRRRVWLPAKRLAVEHDDGFPEELKVHDLRHTAASLAISSGASVLAVQMMLGHAQASMTLNVYAGLFDEDVAELADKMDDTYGAGRKWSAPHVHRDSKGKPPQAI